MSVPRKPNKNNVLEFLTEESVLLGDKRAGIDHIEFLIKSLGYLVNDLRQTDHHNSYGQLIRLKDKLQRVATFGTNLSGVYGDFVNYELYDFDDVTRIASSATAAISVQGFSDEAFNEVKAFIQKLNSVSKQAKKMRVNEIKYSYPSSGVAYPDLADLLRTKLAVGDKSLTVCEVFEDLRGRITSLMIDCFFVENPKSRELARDFIRAGSALDKLEQQLLAYAAKGTECARMFERPEKSLADWIEAMPATFQKVVGCFDGYYGSNKSVPQSVHTLLSYIELSFVNAKSSLLGKY